VDFGGSDFGAVVDGASIEVIEAADAIGAAGLNGGGKAEGSLRAAHGVVLVANGAVHLEGLATEAGVGGGVLVLLHVAGARNGLDTADRRAHIGIRGGESGEVGDEGMHDRVWPVQDVSEWHGILL